MSKNQSPEGLPRESLLRILEVSQKLAESFDPMQLLTEVVEAGKDVLLAERGSLWLYHSESDDLVLHASSSGPPIKVHTGKGLVGECLETQKIINVTDAYSDPRFSDAIDRKTGYKTRSILSIPLLGRQGAPVGVMQLLNKVGGSATFLTEPEAGSASEASEVPAGSGRVPLRIGVRLGTRTILVDAEEIDWVEADGDYMRIHAGERLHLVSSRMHELEERLQPLRFLRIHRSVLVRLDRVKELHRDPDGGGRAVLRTGVQLRVARGRWEALELALGLGT